MNYEELLDWEELKNSDNLTKEDLIISLLKSESSPVECNYIKYFNNSSNDDTYDDKIKGKIIHIRMTFSRLGNIVKKMIERKWKKSFMK